MRKAAGGTAALFVTIMMTNEPEKQGPVEEQQIEQLTRRQETLKLVFKGLKSL